MLIAANDPARTSPPHWAVRATNLGSARIGARAVLASDDFFADAQRMLQHDPAMFVPGKYDERGKWMDGWESRRRRGRGHDWCVVRLGRSGRIVGIAIDTSFFTGNYPAAASLEACRTDTEIPAEGTAWHCLLTEFPVSGHHLEFIPLQSDGIWTHVRLNIFPDGGVARLRIFGTPEVSMHATDSEIDLVALENGGRAIVCNDAHFGSMDNLIMPGRSTSMADGWETRRRREPGHDWCILSLGKSGCVSRVEVDTAHFRGNFPDRASLQAANCAEAADEGLPPQSLWWPILLPEQPLMAHQLHVFESELKELGPITHVRFNIVPDGGVSRLRVWGRMVGSR
jgi:allantoicase